MTQAEWIQLVIALVCAVIACLLAAAETALSVITRARAERLEENGARRADLVKALAADPAPSINALMFTRSAVEIGAIVCVSLVLFVQFGDDWLRAAVTIAIMLAVSFILWGVAPRTLGRQNPERTLVVFAPLINALTTVLGPITQLMILIGNALTPGRGFADGPFASEAELRDLVDIAEANEVIEAGESKMIHSVFELGDTIVKELMVPRTDMVYVTADKTLRQLLSLALRSGFSRIPVIGKDLDDILGVVYLKDVSKRIYDFPDAERQESVGDIMRQASFCPDSKPVNELLHDMQLSHSHLVIVIDEFGGTAGLATIEDILEEIVGEIVDEYDTDLPAIEDLGEGRYRVSARLPVDEFGAIFDEKMEDEDVETVGGLMAKNLNLVPIPGTRTVVNGIELIADKAVGRRHQIGTVLARRLGDDEIAELRGEEGESDDE